MCLKRQGSIIIMPKRHRWISAGLLVMIFFVGLFLRFESVQKTYVIDHFKARVDAASDATQYFMYAFNLRHKNTYSREIGNPNDLRSHVTPDAVRTPGYPLFLTMFVNSLPNREMINRILIAQAVMSSVTIILSYFFFSSYLSIFWVALASILVALSPHLIVANSYVLTETLFCFLLVIIGVMFKLFAKKASSSLIVFIGAILGLASLVRPILQYFPLMMAFLFLLHYKLNRGFRFFILLLIGFAMAYSPWIIRNEVTLNISTGKTQMINFLHHGIYPDFTFNNIPKSYGYPYRYDPNSGKIGKNIGSVLQEIARRFSQETLRHIKWFFIDKPFYFWSWNIVQGSGDAFIYEVSTSPYFNKNYFRWSHMLMFLIQQPLVVLGMFGCFLVWFPISAFGFSESSIFTARFASLLLIYFTLLHMVGAPFPRYSIPLRPFLYGMALFTPHFLIIAIKCKRRLGSIPESPV